MSDRESFDPPRLRRPAPDEDEFGRTPKDPFYGAPIEPRDQHLYAPVGDGTFERWTDRAKGEGDFEAPVVSLGRKRRLSGLVKVGIAAGALGLGLWGGSAAVEALSHDDRVPTPKPIGAQCTGVTVRLENFNEGKFEVGATVQAPEGITVERIVYEVDPARKGEPSTTRTATPDQRLSVKLPKGKYKIGATVISHGPVGKVTAECPAQKIDAADTDRWG